MHFKTEIRLAEFSAYDVAKIRFGRNIRQKDFGNNRVHITESQADKTLCDAFLKDEKLFFEYQKHLEKIDAHIIGRLYAQGENGNKVAFRVR